MVLDFFKVKKEDCPIYFAALDSFPNLATAAALTRSHRTSNPAFAKGFVLDIQTITALIRQNGGNISGIKIYMGKDVGGLFKAVAVSTVGGNYDDFGIPSDENDICNAVLGEARPCPAQCGRNNALNS